LSSRRLFWASMGARFCTTYVSTRWGESTAWASRVYLSGLSSDSPAAARTDPLRCIAFRRPSARTTLVTTAISSSANFPHPPLRVIRVVRGQALSSFFRRTTGEMRADQVGGRCRCLGLPSLCLPAVETPVSAVVPLSLLLLVVFGD